MLKPKRYNILSFLGLCIRIAPSQCFAIIFYTVLISLVPAYQTLTIANFVNTAERIFSGEMSPTSIYLPIILILCYVIYTNLSPCILNLLETSLQNKFRLVLKQEMLLKRTRLKYEHMENDETCELIYRVFEDPVQIFFEGFRQMMKGIGILLQSLSLIILIMSSTFWAGLIILIVTVPLLYLSGKTGQKNYNMGVESTELSRRFEYLFDVLTDRDHADERSLFAYSPKLSEKYTDLYSKANKIETAMLVKRYINMKSGSLVTIILIIVILSVLLRFVIDGSLDSGIFIGLIGALFGLVQSMSWNLSGVMMEMAMLGRYLEDFSEFLRLSEKEQLDMTEDKLSDFIFEMLEFKNVSFKYPNTEKYVLKNCSFLLSKDKKYSFVGINGSGKTTITKLMLGLYDNYEGEILLNGKEIRQYKPCEISSIFSIVFQDFAKYSISIKDNILLGDINKYNPHDLNEALRVSGADEIVSNCPSGLDTYLGKIFDDSVDLSGGQWQKLALARMIYAHKEINILDEPTAALDPVAEAEVYKLFGQAIQDRFTIFITHRLGAAKIADEILVLNEGKVVEQGSHEELMRLEDGIYRKMYESQSAWYIAKES